MLLSVDAPSEEQALAQAHSVCEQLLVNPLLEQYELRAIREPLSDEPSDRNGAR
jgi:phosphoribosylformylglycinamidine (FGAM) synthase PurS component